MKEKNGKLGYEGISWTKSTVRCLISRILSLGYWSVCSEMHVLSAKQLLKCAGLKDPSQ